MVRASGFVALPDLAGTLQVSESTIRRDLDQLESAGSLKRTHGGVYFTGRSPQNDHIEQRQPANWDRKRAIAAVASPLIEDGDSILLDGGSTTYELARLLVGRPIQVVTNSLPVATLFSASERSDLVFVGGCIHANTGVSLGPYATEMISRLNVRKTVVSVAGVNERGLYNANLLLVETEKAMMQVADQVIVVADSSKFGHASLALMARLEDVDTLIVDDGLSQDWRTRLASAGVSLRIASLGANGTH